MSLLEFILILISVVIGLGLAEILGGAANLLRDRATVRGYWLHTALQVGIFIALIQQWWETWDLQAMDEITLFGVFALLAAPIGLFLIARLLYPRPGQDTDLREYYYQQNSVLWTLIVISAVLGTLLRPFAFGSPLLDPANASAIPTIILGGALAVSGREKLHEFVVPTLLLLLVLDTILTTSVISVR